MRRPVQLATLQFAIVVAEEGSFLGASKRLAIDHTALSRRIRDLELAIGMSVFHRHPGGVRPTAAGARLLERLSRVLSDLDSTLSLASMAPLESRQPLRMGSDASLLSGRLLEIVAEFAETRPHLTIVLHEGPSSEISAALAHGSLDLIVTPTLRSWATDSELTLWRDMLAVVLPSDHRLAASPVVEHSQLKAETLLVRRGEAPLLADLLSAGISTLSMVVEHRVGTPVLLRLVRKRLGMALVQYGDAGNVPEGTVCRILAVGGRTIRVTNAVRWRRDNNSAALRELVEFLRLQATKPHGAGSMRRSGSASPLQIPDPSP